MKNLEKAGELLQQPVTVEVMLELDNLCAISHGEEANRIGDLIEAARAQADEDVLIEYFERVTGERLR